MPKFYCEYCSIYLTHSSPAGRKQHSQGRKHINAKVDYYQRLVRDQFFQPPAFLAPQVPYFPTFPVMGVIPGFPPPIQPGNMVPKFDSNQPFIPPQGLLPPMSGTIPPPLPGGIPVTMPPGVPGPLPVPLPGGLPGGLPPMPGVVPSVPVIPRDFPNAPSDANSNQPIPMPSGQQASSSQDVSN